jgi:hypothetical protein
MKIARLFSDEIFLKMKYRRKMGTPLNLQSPTTFNEKLQWLKLRNRKPCYTTMVDKFAVKEYVAGIIGKEYIIPTLGVWEKFDDINFDTLPQQFVLKTTHGGGGTGVVICKDKATFDKKKAKKNLEKSLKKCLYKKYVEWPYKDVPKRIIAEEYITDGKSELEDYKVHNFNGTPRVILVCRNRFHSTPMVTDFYSTDWELLPVTRPGHPCSPAPMEKPRLLPQILQLSKILSKDIPFVRTDFYILNDKIYFGELTFFPASGMKKFEPQEWDRKFGEWIEL